MLPIVAGIRDERSEQAQSCCISVAASENGISFHQRTFFLVSQFLPEIRVNLIKIWFVTFCCAHSVDIDLLL